MFVFIVDFLALSTLRKDWKYTLRSAYSGGTFSNLRTQFKAFLLFCTYFMLYPDAGYYLFVCAIS